MFRGVELLTDFGGDGGVDELLAVGGIITVAGASPFSLFILETRTRLSAVQNIH